MDEPRREPDDRPQRPVYNDLRDDYDDDFGIIRITGNGQLDTSFGDNGQLTADFSLENDAAFGVIVMCRPSASTLAGTAAPPASSRVTAARFVPSLNTG